jgi:hypothetical protein
MSRIISNKRFIGLFCFIALGGLLSCATPPVAERVPPFKAFMGTSWGISPEDAKRVIESEGRKVFEERLNEPPYALYASGTYLNSPAIFTYFFTPKSKKLYRVDLTFKDLNAYQRVKTHLMNELQAADYSLPKIDYWSWSDMSMVILQQEPDSFQLSYSGGEIAKLNHEEGNGLLQRK